MFFDFVPLCLHLKKKSTLSSFFLIYWTCSVGFTGENLQKISSLMAFTQCISDPWVAIGDLNVSPSTLVAQTWFQGLGLQILVPSNSKWVPRAPFAPPSGAAVVDCLIFDDQVCWKTHFGPTLTIKAEKESNLFSF